MEQQWISVEDRLPEFNESNDHKKDVLLYIPRREGVRQHGVYIGCLHPTKGDPKGEHNFWGIKTEDCDWTIWGWSYFEHPVVSAWMPLPKPPEGEQV